MSYEKNTLAVKTVINISSNKTLYLSGHFVTNLIKVGLLPSTPRKNTHLK